LPHNDPTLVPDNIIEEEEGELIEEAERSTTNQRKDKEALGMCRGKLVTSLQLLGEYKGHITPKTKLISVIHPLEEVLTRCRGHLVA
jgi:hypothetical protein